MVAPNVPIQPHFHLDGLLIQRLVDSPLFLHLSSVAATQTRVTSYSDVVTGRRDFVSECLASLEVADPVV